jgi:hypothetical protein
MKIDDSNFKKAIRVRHFIFFRESSAQKVETLEDKLQKNSVFATSDMQGRYLQYCKKMQLDEQIKAAKKAVKATEQVILKDQLKNMKRVLRRFSFSFFKSSLNP